MIVLRALARALVAALILGASLTAQAQDPGQTLLHLLDYIGVDYDGAVEKGRVKSEEEYREMLEFSGQVVERVRALPARPPRDALAASAVELQSMIQAMADPDAVAASSAKLRWALIEAYGLQVSPRSAPDMRAAPALYAQHCAACHGVTGRGDGPAGKSLDPRPSSFHDGDRMASRSAYGLYNTISLGVEGTGMAAFGQLGEEERLSLIHI